MVCLGAHGAAPAYALGLRSHEEEEPSDVAKALWASERGCVQDDYGTDDDEHEDPYAGIPFRAVAELAASMRPNDDEDDAAVDNDDHEDDQLADCDDGCDDCGGCVDRFLR